MIKCSTNLSFYHFSPTRLITSTLKQHSCKILYLSIFVDILQVLKFEFLMLGLHYVPGSHGSHGSQKRSSLWCFESVLSLCSNSVKSRYVFSRSFKVCRDRLAGGLGSVTDSSTFPRGLSHSVGTSHILLGCDQVLLRLSSSVKVF